MTCKLWCDRTWIVSKFPGISSKWQIRTQRIFCISTVNWNAKVIRKYCGLFWTDWGKVEWNTNSSKTLLNSVNPTKWNMQDFFYTCVFHNLKLLDLSVLSYRYYYKREILERVDGRRLVYKFGRNARGWRESDKWRFH